MNDPSRKKLSIPQKMSLRRRNVDVLHDASVIESYLTDQIRLPLMIQPGVEGIDLCAWAEHNRDTINHKLFEHGGVLFRGFGLSSAEEFQKFVLSTSSELLEYLERSSPRSAVLGRVYTSTNYPASQSIFLHNENSYQHSWPLKIFFFCHTAPVCGGETLIADCRKVLSRLDPEIAVRFREKKVMYVRNFSRGFGLPWQTVFQTTNKDRVEDYCRRAGIEVEWREADRLKTRQVREAVTIHPLTREAVWFNHAAFFHVSTLEPAVGEALQSQFEEGNLPHNTYYGDGSRIEPEVLDAIRSAYLKETVKLSWRKGDLLFLDNMLVAHGRAPFTGQRKILVGMADPYSHDPQGVPCGLGQKS
jgi:alpha-ketoglutarate-dependent taurine dioxygenase